MHKSDVKFIYYEDKYGATLGYTDKIRSGVEDILIIVIIADRNRLSGDTFSEWDIGRRDSDCAVDLRKIKKYKLYENYEEFFEEYFEAIL